MYNSQSIDLLGAAAAVVVVVVVVVVRESLKIGVVGEIIVFNSNSN